MKRIGYIDNEKRYLESHIEGLNLSEPSVPLESKINTLFSDEEITKRASCLKSGIDIFRFYRRVIKEYIPNEGEITLYGGYSEKNIKKGKKYTVLVNLEENNDDKFWVWSNRSHQMKDLSKGYMKQFLDDGRVKIVPGKKNIEKCEDMLERLNKEQIIEYNSKFKFDEAWIK